MNSRSKIIVILAALLTASGCGKDSADTHRLIQVNENVFTFTDGETVSTWRYPNDNKLLYLLDDGTELLATFAVGTPEKSTVEGVEQISELNQTAQKNISDFYDQQGALYSVETYLEKAYTEYTSGETRATFRCYSLNQETFTSSSNDQIIYCTTAVQLPLGQGVYDQYYLTQAFDKKSGSTIDLWDLFTVSNEDAKTALLSDYTTDLDTLHVLCSDFRPEYIRFYPDGYEIRFPYETSVHLATSDTAPSNIAFNNKYTDGVLSVLNVWAIPK